MAIENLDFGGGNKLGRAVGLITGAGKAIAGVATLNPALVAGGAGDILSNSGSDKGKKLGGAISTAAGAAGAVGGALGGGGVSGVRGAQGEANLGVNTDLKSQLSPALQAPDAGALARRVGSGGAASLAPSLQMPDFGASTQNIPAPGLGLTPFGRRFNGY